MPAGHPEAFLEAFANVYRDAFADMRRMNRGEVIDADVSLYPKVTDGADGVRFMTRCLESSDNESSWKAW